MKLIILLALLITSPLSADQFKETPVELINRAAISDDLALAQEAMSRCTGLSLLLSSYYDEGSESEEMLLGHFTQFFTSSFIIRSIILGRAGVEFTEDSVMDDLQVEFSKYLAVYESFIQTDPNTEQDEYIVGDLVDCNVILKSMDDVHKAFPEKTQLKIIDEK